MALSEPSEDQPSASLAEQLDEVIVEFEDLQSEFTYAQTKGAIESILERLELTPRETSELKQEMQTLTALIQKLDRGMVQIAVFGLVGRGKSSLLNALVGEAVFATGPTHGITQTVQSAQWQVSQEHWSGATLQRATLPGVGESQIELIDTPGLDEVAGAEREQLAQQVAASADLILFVIAGDITRVEYEALSQLRSASKPILLVFNKIDQYPDVDRQVIFQALVDERLRELISPDEIVMASAAPLVALATPQADGRVRPVRQRGEPDVVALKLKILEILQQEGLALVALNTLLYADELNEVIVQKKLAIREQTANEIIWRSVMMKAIAVALNPVTILDVLTGAVLDVAMIITLSRLYGLPLTQGGAVTLLRSIALELGGLSASELLVTLGLSSLKGLLSVSAPATGGLSLAPYTSVAMTQAAVVGVATYGIGLVTKQYLANGATWGPDGPKSVVTQILNNLDEASILNRIKTELAQKLQTKPE